MSHCTLDLYALVLYMVWSAVTALISSPAPLPLTHSLPATKASSFHLRTFAFDILTGMPAPSLAISFPHFFWILTQKSASQQGILWPLQLKCHFLIFCCLSLSNYCLTFKTYFISAFYYEKVKTQKSKELHSKHSYTCHIYLVYN